MKRRTLGQGLEVSAIGIGCMPLSGQNYGDVDEAQAVRALNHALDIGINFLDTAQTYGGDGTDRTNERFIGSVLAHRRDDVVIGTKFGTHHVPYSDGAVRDSRPDVVKAACDGSLLALGVDHIDLYYQHGVDPKVPIEETWGALRELVEAGKVLHVGICEPGMETLRRAHAVFPVTAVQSEYSLFSRDPEGEVLETLDELGIGFVPYAPLARGFLSGQFRHPEDFPAKDHRRLLPRFQGENFYKNLQLVDKIHELASARGVSATVYGLAWLLNRGPHIVPIPGMVTADMIDENAQAVDITLTAAELTAIDEVIPEGAFGLRHLPSVSKGVESPLPR